MLGIPRIINIILDIFLIILLLTGVIMVWGEVLVMKKYGGECVHDPMRWAEKYSLEENGVKLSCRCYEYIDIRNLNLNKSQEVKYGKTKS